MDLVALESVTKIYRHKPGLFNLLGRERKGETRALDSVSLTALPGEVLVLLGPNGSGKSSILRLISTMLLPDSGKVLVGGDDTLRDSARARRKVGFAVASERSFFPRLTARENLDFFATLEDLPRARRPDAVQKALTDCALLEVADTLVMKFSSGLYQRLGIARALLKSPSVLLLDEPTRSLDPGSARKLWHLLRGRAPGSTTLLATHNFDEAVAVGDSVHVLLHGRIVASRNLRESSAEELRAFYFKQTEAAEPGRVS